MNVCDFKIRLAYSEEHFEELYSVISEFFCSETKRKKSSPILDFFDFSTHGSPFCFHLTFNFMFPKKYLSGIPLNSEIDEEEVTALIDKEEELKNKSVKEGFLSEGEIELRISFSFTSENFSIKFLKKHLNQIEIKNRFDIIEKILKEGKKIIISPNMIYEVKKTKPLIGGIMLPQPMPTLKDELGKPNLEYVGYSFDNSKLGLNRLGIQGTKETYIFCFYYDQLDFNENNLMITLERIENLSRSILKMMMANE